MADPLSLQVGDLVRFIALPTEWQQPNYLVHRDSVRFMKKLIARSWPSRVSEINEHGYAWIDARMRVRGRWTYHRWLITEKTGWRKVQRRSVL